MRLEHCDTVRCVHFGRSDKCRSQSGTSDRCALSGRPLVSLRSYGEGSQLLIKFAFLAAIFLLAH